MKKLKKINKQKIIRTSLYILVFIIGTYILVGLYSLIFEQDKLAIDRYNFGQLEKVKLGLKDIPREQYKFRNFIEFDNKYANLGIKPKKNCYYVSNSNGKESYIFGFKLYSYKYINKYGTGYYIHPKYDLPVDMFCDGGPKCKDINYYFFIETISNPCED